MKIYHLKSCDTCRKAIKALRAQGYNPELIDVRVDGITMDTLVKIEALMGYEKLLNTRSTTWRGLADADKADMSADKALALIAQHPTLMKRPIIMDGIMDGGKITLGWTKEAQAAWQ